MVIITDHDEASDARGGGVLHPDDGDRKQEVAAVGADVLHAGTEMAAVGAAGGDSLHPGGGLHPDDGDRGQEVAAVGADVLHAGTEMAAVGAAGGDSLHPGGGDQIVKPKVLMDLPDGMLSEIVKRLPLKEAVSTSVLSKQWRYLWRTRRTLSAPNLYIHLHPTSASVLRVLEELHHTVFYDIERFTLILDVNLDQNQLKQFMEFANQRHVSHLHVYGCFGRNFWPYDALEFTLPQENPSLKSLWLQHISVWRLFCHDGRKPFDSLTSIQLYRVRMTRNTFNRLLKLSPLLRSIDIRYGILLGFTLFSPDVTSSCPNLNRVVVAHSGARTILQPAIVPQLDSFMYSDDFNTAGFSLPETAVLNDLYICFQKVVSRSPELYDKLCFALPGHLTMLKVLTICTRALKVVLPKFYLSAGYDKLKDLKMLAELQLLVFALDSQDLNLVFAFLGQCKYPNLKRLFVQIDTDEVNDSANDIHEDEPECCFGAVDVAKVANVTWSYNQVKLICFLEKVTKELNVVSETAAPQYLVGNTQWEHNVDTGKIVITTPDADRLKAFHLEAYLQ